jgi:hypothetical protein
LRAKFQTHAAVILFYFGIALIITWPLVTVLSTHLAGFAYGDGHEMAHHIWWYNHALRTGQDIFYQPLLGYPNGIDGVLYWAHPLQFFPAWLFAYFLPLPGAANLAILLAMAFNGWGMYCLASYLLDNARIPALLAGVVFMAAPTFQGHLGGGHAGLMVMWPAPLYLLALFKLRGSVGAQRAAPLQIMKMRIANLFGDRETRRWLALAILFFVLSNMGHILQLIYLLLPVTGVFMLTLLVRREWVALARTILVGILGCAFLMIFLLPILQSTLNTPAYTDESGFVRYSADLLSVVSPSFYHPLYSALDYPRRVLGVNLEEGVSYIGIVAGILALIGVWKKSAARWWLILALVVWVLSLGPLLKIFDQPVLLEIDGYTSFITSPWSLLQNLPFFSLARTPGRFNFALALAVAVIAGYGAAWVWERLSKIWAHRPDGTSVGRRAPLQWSIFLAVTAFILFDYQLYWPLPIISAAIPEQVYALRERDDIRAVFDVPWDNLIAAKDALYLQTAHQLPLVGGHLTRSTPVSPAKLTLLQATLDPALLNAAGANIIILHKAYISPEIDHFTREKLGTPFYEDADIALFDQPETQNENASVRLLTTQTISSDNADSYLYESNSGWVNFSGTLAANGREVELYLDRRLIHRWLVDGETAFNIPIPVTAQTYHTVRLALNPPCPQLSGAALRCRALEMRDLAFGALNPAEDVNWQFDRGITLVRTFVPESAEAGENLPMNLLWRFDAPRNGTEIRFLHVLSQNDELVAQFDSTLGDQPAGGMWAESVNIALPDDLLPGMYRVYAGWYTYPDATRFNVLSDGDGAQNNLVFVGAFEIG